MVESECKEELMLQIRMAQAFNVPVNFIDRAEQLSSYFEQVDAGTVVDCLFGTGVQLPLSNFIYEVIDYINVVHKLIGKNIKSEIEIIKGSI